MHRNFKMYLLSCICWEIEDDHTERGDERAGDDEVDGVIERLTTQFDLVDRPCHVVSLVHVVSRVDLSRTIDEVPGTAVLIVGHVNVCVIL